MLRRCGSHRIVLAIVTALACSGFALDPLFAEEPAFPATAVKAPATSIPAAKSAPAAPATATPADEIGTWISQLGDDRFAIREAATEHLSHQGIEIQPRLLAALEDPDPEVRFRVRRILTMVIEADFQKRLAAFAEDVNDTKHLSLPGWTRFRTTFANDAAGRKMFVEMQRAEPQLMQAFETGPTAASQALETRLHEIQDAMQMRFRFGNNASVGMSSVMALLFVATDNHVTLNEEAAFQLCNFCVQPLTIQTNAGNGDSTISRKIIGAWIARDASANVLQQNLWLAMRYNLKEGLAPAANALQQGNQPVQVKQAALLLIGKLGGKEYLPAVQTCLKDADVCGRFNINNVQIETQCRDVALAVCIRLEGLNPKDFGFDHLEANDQWLYAPHTLGFRSTDEREAAHKKWDAYLAAHRNGAQTPKKS